MDDLIEEQPIAFLSRSFHGAQLRWSTPEKECYAIFLALQKWKHLLQSARFTLRTDHKNLTYLNFAGSDKVIRWKLLIQSFNFDIEYIKGKDNEIADAFSRLCSSAECAKSSDPEIICLGEEFTVPDELHRVIAQWHNTNVGHHGVERTLNKLKSAGHNWQYMAEHVRRFIKRCPCCQKMSQIKIPIYTHRYTTRTYAPFERLNIDTMGPFPVDDFGNEYVIVIRDTFTRAIGLYAARDTSASAAAKAIMQFVGWFGCPSEILTDGGSQYDNNVISELCQLLGVENNQTLRYSKEQNAIVERANKEVLRHLRNMLYDRRIVNKWSDCLPLVQRIMMNESIEHLGDSPAQMAFGNMINLDRGIVLNNIPADEGQHQIALSKWTQSMSHNQAILLE